MSYITLEEFNSNLEQRINKDLSDIEIIAPEESFAYPGFYIIPGFNHLLISKAFQVLSLLTNKILPEHIHKVNNNQYATIKVGYDYRRADGTHKTQRYLLSRLIARAFIGRPSRHTNKIYDELQVNHINGNPMDNALRNLEWCVAKENIHHARLHLSSKNEKAVLAKNIDTGEILRFKKAIDCCRYFNIPKTTFSSHLKSKHLDKGVKNRHIFKYDDGTEWLELDIDNIFEICTGSYEYSKRRVSAKNLFTHEIKTFASITEAANYFDVDPLLLGNNLLPKVKIKGHVKGWIFKYTDGDSVWVINDINNMYEIGITYKPKPVIYNNVTYKNIAEMARQLNVGPTTAGRWLKQTQEDIK